MTQDIPMGRLSHRVPQATKDKVVKVASLLTLLRGEEVKKAEVVRQAIDVYCDTVLAHHKEQKKEDLG